MLKNSGRLKAKGWRLKNDLDEKPLRPLQPSALGLQPQNGVLTDKVCVVTGAGKGIGRAVAELFYEQGARLAVISRTASDLEELRRALRPEDERWLAMAGDVSQERDVQEFVTKALKACGRIDVLINNAGIRFRKPFLEISLREWNDVLAANLGSTYLCCREVGRHMVANRAGRIVNMASIIGTLGLPNVAGYGASKGGIITLTKCLAMEWAGYHVNVNAVAPGFCETSYAPAFRQRTDLYRFTLERTPQGRWGAPREVAEACLFLASDASSYITGQVLSVDGGWSAW